MILAVWILSMCPVRCRLVRGAAVLTCLDNLNLKANFRVMYWLRSTRLPPLPGTAAGSSPALMWWFLKNHSAGIFNPLFRGTGRCCPAMAGMVFIKNHSAGIFNPSVPRPSYRWITCEVLTGLRICARLGRTSRAAQKVSKHGAFAPSPHQGAP